MSCFLFIIHQTNLLDLILSDLNWRTWGHKRPKAWLQGEWMKTPHKLGLSFYIFILAINSIKIWKTEKIEYLMCKSRVPECSIWMMLLWHPKDGWLLLSRLMWANKWISSLHNQSSVSTGLWLMSVECPPGKINSYTKSYWVATNIFCKGHPVLWRYACCQVAL